MSGHVFVVRGDMRRLCCDAWCLPCDRLGNVVPAWLDKLRGEVGAAPTQVELTHLRDAFQYVDVEVGGRSFARYIAKPERLTGADDWGADAGRVAEVADWDPAWGPLPFLLNVGSRDRPISWYMEGLRQYLERAHARLTGADAPPARHGRARPLIAVHAVGTGAGGADRRKAQIIWPQMALLHEFVRDPGCGVDVAFVAWEASTFAAAQACRRANLRDPASPEGPAADVDPPERFWPDLDPERREAAQRLARRASAGNLVLFLGAGISRPAGLPDWGGLLAEAARDHPGLRGQLDALAGLELLDQAQLIERRAPDLRRWVADRLRAGRCALGHALIASLPVREVVTQNYDELYELAAEAAELPAAVIPGTEATEAHRWVLKMHGSIDRPDEIVLTRSDYLRYGERRAALAGIVQALLITKHMLFVGFSLSDPNFHRIADDVRKVVRQSARGRFGTVLLLQEEPLREQLWEDDLRLIPQAPAKGDIAEAARQHDIFLDYLLYEASASAGYLLDPGYAHALTAAESRLKEALLGLRAFAAELQGTPAWEAVVRLLRELGGEA